MRPRPIPFRLFIFLGLLAAAAITWVASGSAQTSQAAAPTALPRAFPTITTEPLPPNATVTAVLSNMVNPIAMAFDNSGRLFYTEKTTGNVRLFANGVLQPTPVINFSVNASGEQGLLGIALDPNFDANHYIYVYYTCNCTPLENRVVRFVENNGIGSNPVTIFTSPDDTTCSNHNGGNIHFGPDGKLYISIGDDGCTAANSQNVQVKNGKMHRINPDGTIPGDNPVFTQTGALPSLYAMGLRNSFDFDIDPLTAMSPWPRIFASENGPSCDDEMNRIEGGYNYGWRASYPCDDPNPSPTYNTIPPMWYLPSGQCCQAPTGVRVYTGTLVPQWTNDLFMCSYNNSALRHFYLNPSRTDAVTVATVSGVSCGMDIETGPDGAFYYLQGGGYSPGTLMKITVAGAPTSTPTTIPPTATRTNTPLPTNTPGVPTFTATVLGTATRTNTPVQATPTNTMVMPTNTRTNTPLPTNTPGGPSETPTLSPTRTQYPTFTATPTEVAFQDVPPGHTFYPYVSCLTRTGILNGYPCGSPGEPCIGPGNLPYFRPNNNVSRGQIAKIVSEAAAFDADIPPSQQTFEDVAPLSTFWVYIERLASYNIMSGYPCGGPGEPCSSQQRPYFRPALSVTRGQIAKIVSNAAGFNDTIPVGTQTFADVPEGHTFYEFVERLIINRPEVMSGYPCGGPGEPCDPQQRPYFRPGASATRGQIAKIVSNTFYPDCVLPVKVKIELYQFVPADITIAQGTTVRFINRDLDYHTATADDNSFNTGNIYQNQYRDITFNTLGSFGYYCIPHPYMRGVVNVVAPNDPRLKK